MAGLNIAGLNTAQPPAADALQRLKILIDSSTPIIAMETVEEMRAVRMVRAACAAINLATFEVLQRDIPARRSMPPCRPRSTRRIPRKNR
jgi:hypothetical protein